MPWKTFWLGILVLGFLTWTWWHSYQHPFHITRFQAPRYYQAFHTHGEVPFRHLGSAQPSDAASGDFPPGN